MSTQTDEHQYVAKLGNLKTVFQLLKAVNFQETAMFLVSEDGLKVTVEDSKCVQGSAYIPIHVFEEFTLKADAYFKINLTVLVECLAMFWTQMASGASSAALQIHYKGAGHPVTVLIEEDGIITDCSLKTQEPDEILDFQMSPDQVLNRVVLHTTLLRDIWSELDPSCSFVELLLSPKAPHFQIGTDSLAGECRIELPHNSDLVETFDCKKATSFFYEFSRLKQAMRAIACASKVSIRTNDVGLLSFQFMVKTDDGQTCFIEFYLPPVLETDD